MKHLFTLITLTALLCATQPFAQAQNCCVKADAGNMKLLAMNKSFRSAHEAPLPLHYTPQKGGMMTFKTGSGADGNAFFVPADVESDKVLIIVHEWWGLNDYIKREAERWQQLLGGKVAVYAVDLYDGKVGTTPDEASKLMNGLDAKRAQAILNGLVTKIGAGKSIATMGWCMGGSWSFMATMATGSEAAGCVMYYGFPEKDFRKIKDLKADVLYVYGTRDNFIKPDNVADFGRAVQKTGHRFSRHDYDAVHAFANPSNPKYDARSAADAQVYVLKFLKEKLSVE